MHKIVVEKDESVADLIERILEAEHESIRLVVPKKSHLLDSPNNFRLLARESQVLGKSIEIESVDQDVLTLAKENGLASTHPLFDERPPEIEGEKVSDIVSTGKKRKTKVVEADEEAVPLTVQYEDENAPSRKEIIEGESSEERYDSLDDVDSGEGLRWGRVAAIGIGALAVLFLLIWGFDTAFGKAEVTLRFKRTPFNFTDQVAALTSVKDVDTAKNLIPGQLFAEQKSLVQNFPATGRANTSVKAKGTITVVNNYSAEAQQLVATTRFETPDGKIFRLDQGIVVPGKPGSIKAQVTADVAGPAGNVGKVDKLTIPGFKGTPKFDGFYGTLENGASGGATGDHAVATDQDVTSAKSKVNDILKGAFQTGFLGAIPADIKVLDGASVLVPGKVTVDRTAGADGNFNLTAEALFQSFGFREKDVYTLLNANTVTSSVPMQLINPSLTYSDIHPDFTSKKELQFSLNAKGDLVPVFDAEAFKGKVSGIKRADAQAEILALPQLEDAQVKLWPAWLRSLPGNTGHITITVE